MSKRRMLLMCAVLFAFISGVGAADVDAKPAVTVHAPKVSINPVQKKHKKPHKRRHKHRRHHHKKTA